MEREGEGWRLAWESQREPFPVLIGGEGWASELSAPEARALATALQALLAQHQSLVDTLMEEEAITLEWTGSIPGPPSREGGELWVALEGDRRAWTLRLLLRPVVNTRALEAFWARGAAAAFARAYADVVGEALATLVPPDP
jgi:hypothetical protein